MCPYLIISYIKKHKIFRKNTILYNENMILFYMEKSGIGGMMIWQEEEEDMMMEKN